MLSYREIFKFADGGETKLLWSNIEGFTDRTPIVVILPGLTGCGCNDYISSIVSAVNRRKYRQVMFILLICVQMPCLE